MKRVVLSLSLSISVALVAAFVAALVYSAAVVDVRAVSATFVPSWVFANAGLILFDIFPALTIGAVMVCFSLLVRSGDLKGTKGERLHPTMQITVFVLLAVVGLLTVLRLVLGPTYFSMRENGRVRTATARVLVERADQLMADDRWVEALTAAEFALRVDPAATAAVELIGAVNSRLTRYRAETIAAADYQPLGPRDRDNRSFAEIVATAQAAYDADDFFTAAFYAERALQTPVGNRDDQIARTILERSRAIIERARFSADERAQRERFVRKRFGIQSYETGNLIEAYYTFTELAREMPGDADVATWLPRVRDALTQEAFFADEVERSSLDSRFAVTVRSDQRPDEWEFLHARELIPVGATGYLRGVELIRIRRDAGRLVTVYHVSADLAKFHHGRLLFTALDRDRRVLVSELTVHAGALPVDAERGLPFFADMTDLLVLADTDPRFRGTSVVDLMQLHELMARYGLSNDSAAVEILNRLVEPLAIVSLALIGAWLAWRLRVPDARITVTRIAVMAVIPAGVHVLWDAYRYVTTLIGSGLVASAGLAGAFLVVSVVQIGQLMVALVLTSRVK